jgi:hypothetical protein
MNKLTKILTMSRYYVNYWAYETSMLNTECVSLRSDYNSCTEEQHEYYVKDFEEKYKDYIIEKDSTHLLKPGCENTTCMWEYCTILRLKGSVGEIVFPRNEK